MTIDKREIFFMDRAAFDWKSHPWARDVGPGWAKVIQPLVDYAIVHDLRISQIKEKFGTLRFYSALDDTLDKMIEEAEKLSSETCEACGAPGRVRHTGWWLCLCDACEDREVADGARAKDESRSEEDWSPA